MSAPTLGVLHFQSSSEFKLKMYAVAIGKAVGNFQSSSEFKTCTAVICVCSVYSFNPLLSLRKYKVIARYL